MYFSDRVRKELRYLGHPARKRIIELLGSKEVVSITELRAETGLPVGTLYYHLDVLKDLIVQDEERKYHLSREGRKIYESLVKEKGLPVASTVVSRFLPGWLFIKVGENLGVAVLSWMIIGLLGSLLSYYEGGVQFLVHYGFSTLSGWLRALFFPISMAFYSVFNYLLVWFLVGRRVLASGFFASGIVYAPFLFIPILSVVAFDTFSVYKIIFLFIVIFAQILFLILGATYVSVVYGIRFERSLLIQLIFYLIASLAFSFLQLLNLINEPWMI
ncbi:MAG: helix-turn-helix domain-containing protein [Nitrososphaeria archaeon]